MYYLGRVIKKNLYHYRKGLKELPVVLSIEKAFSVFPLLIEYETPPPSLSIANKHTRLGILPEFSATLTVIEDLVKTGGLLLMLMTLTDTIAFDDSV